MSYEYYLCKIIKQIFRFLLHNNIFMVKSMKRIELHNYDRPIIWKGGI